MFRKHLVLTVSLILSLLASAQQNNDPVLFEIGDQRIHSSEFRKEFLRSIGQDPSVEPTMCSYEKRQKIEEYARLFLNFRLKLTDAYALGYDTIPALQRELASYRTELAQPYLMDSATLRAIMQEAYDRNHYALHAAHILIYLENSKDTAAAYEMAMEAYRRASAGEDFYTLASEMVERQLTDEQKIRYKRRPMEGDLGCFTAFDMLYPFESAAYALQIGEVSMPVRTRYGYHVIKLFSKTPFYGPVSLRHIWIREGGNNARAQRRIEFVYAQLLEGHDFVDLYNNNSDDAGTGQLPEGLMSNVSCTQLPPDYVVQLANLSREGDFSKPFQTEFGWHIIQLVHRDSIPSLESLMPRYKQQMSRDSRNSMPREEFIVRSLAKYHHVDYTATLGTWKQTAGKWQFSPARKNDKKAQPAASLDAVVAIATDSLFDKRWVFDSTTLTDHRPLMEIDGQLYTTDDFCRYLAKNQQLGVRRSLDRYIRTRYDNFIGDMLMHLVDSRLEQDHPDFAEVMQEYRHGLMIFAYNDDKIWKAAAADSVGLADFYTTRVNQLDFENPDDELYFWHSRARTNIFTIPDSSLLSPEKAAKIVEKGIRKNRDANGVKEELQKAIKNKKAQITLQLELLEDQHQSFLSESEWHKGYYLHPSAKGYHILWVESMLSPEPKDLSEARGYYLNDYQNEVERRLVDQLRQQYHAVMHQEVLDSITY
mgnify:CR=1 FL=1